MQCFTTIKLMFLSICACPPDLSASPVQSVLYTNGEIPVIEKKRRILLNNSLVKQMQLGHTNKPKLS